MSEPETGPELPEVLYATWHPVHGFTGWEDHDIQVWRSNADAEIAIELSGLVPGDAVPVLIGVHPRWRDEAERLRRACKNFASHAEKATREGPQRYMKECLELRRELATIKARVQFLMGFVDASDPKAIGLSSEHSVGEQIVKLAKLVKGKDA